jgi:tetratricopeptide (TPR) repeat protein
MERTTIKEEAVMEPALAKEIIAVAPVEIKEHLQWGKALFKAGNYEEALEEFEAILEVAPDDVQARFWRQSAKDALTGSKKHKVHPAKPVNIESLERTKLAIRAYRAKKAAIEETVAEDYQTD